MSLNTAMASKKQNKTSKTNKNNCIKYLHMQYAQEKKNNPTVAASMITKLSLS